MLNYLSKVNYYLSKYGFESRTYGSNVCHQGKE